MKEFFGQYGGRTLFNEDLEALRELGLSFHHIFEDFSGNFIISGCEVNINRTSTSTITTISGGYVWLDGKIRVVASSSFAGYDGPLYISSKNTDGKSIHYATRGVSGFMSKNYGTTVTNSIPSYNHIVCKANDNSNNLINRFYDKYVVSKGNNKQIIESETDIQRELYIKNAVIGNDISATIRLDGKCRLTVDISKNNMLKYKYVVSNGISIYDANGDLVMEFKNGSTTKVKLPSVQSKSANYTAINAKYVKINGVDLSNFLYRKYVMNWVNLKYMDGSDVKTLFAQRVDLRISIVGTIPINDEKFSFEQVTYPNTRYLRSYMTSITLPSSIPSPPSGEIYPIRVCENTDNNTCYYLRIGDTIHQNYRPLYIDVCSKDNKIDIEELQSLSISINWNYYFA